MGGRPCLAGAFSSDSSFALTPERLALYSEDQFDYPLVHFAGMKRWRWFSTTAVATIVQETLAAASWCVF